MMVSLPVNVDPVALLMAPVTRMTAHCYVVVPSTVHIHQVTLLVILLTSMTAYTSGRLPYGIMTEELFIREIRIDEAASRGDSDSRMTCFEVIMPLKVGECKSHVLIRMLSYFSKWKR